MKKIGAFITILSVLFFFTPIPTQAAGIAFDVTAQGPDTGSVTTINWNHTVTGSNPILFVCFRSAGNTSATYNGVAMTSAGSVAAASGGSSFAIYMFYLKNPATGTHSVVISSDTTAEMNGASVSYTGAKQTGGTDAATTNKTSSASSITTTLTTVAASTWAVLCTGSDSEVAGAGTGSTLRTSGQPNLFDTNAALTAGNNSMTVTTAVARNYSVIMASFAPVSGASFQLWPFSLF